MGDEGGELLKNGDELMDLTMGGCGSWGDLVQLFKKS